MFPREHAAMPGDIFSITVEEMPLAGGAQKSRMLPNILPDTGKLPTTKNYPPPSVLVLRP